MTEEERSPFIKFLKSLVEADKTIRENETKKLVAAITKEFEKNQKQREELKNLGIEGTEGLTGEQLEFYLKMAKLQKDIDIHNKIFDVLYPEKRPIADENEGSVIDYDEDYEDIEEEDLEDEEENDLDDEAFNDLWEDN